MTGDRLFYAKSASVKLGPIFGPWAREGETAVNMRSLKSITELSAGS